MAAIFVVAGPPPKMYVCVCVCSLSGHESFLCGAPSLPLLLPLSIGGDRLKVARDWYLGMYVNRARDGLATGPPPQCVDRDNTLAEPVRGCDALYGFEGRNCSQNLYF